MMRSLFKKLEILLNVMNRGYIDSHEERLVCQSRLNKEKVILI
jgi:hypothetical protein